MKLKYLLIIIVLIAINSISQLYAQSTNPNLGFEYNNFSFWKCYKNGTILPSSNGTVNTTTQDLYNGTTYYVPGTGVITKYIRVTLPSQKNDPYGNYPVVCPLPGAGKHSVKLGTDSINLTGGTYGSAVSQGLIYNIRIPDNAQKYKIVYYYAIDLESPSGHPCDAMPFFQAEAFDSVTGEVVAPCSNLSTNICDAIANGWKKSNVYHDVYGDGAELDTIYYMNWTPSTIIAENMGGRTLTMRFTSAGCTYGAHFGYAYVDFDTTNNGLINFIYDTLRYNRKDSCLSYTPPSGYKGYTVIDSATGQQLGIDTSHAIGSVNTITMCGTNLPKLKSVLQVILTPYTKTGCNDTISYYIDTLPFIPKKDTLNLVGCNSLNYKGNLYTSSAIVYDTLKNSFGYDSVYSLVNITINNKSISGGIYHPSKGYVISDVSVSMGGSNTSNLTNTGNYSINCITNGANGTIRLHKNNDVNKCNGVTVLDIALVQSHILQKAIISNPYKLIAADVSGDNKITALDIVYMKRLIFGVDTTFTNSTTKENRLWVFVDSSYKFPNSAKPFPFKDSISFTKLNATKINQSFIGIKLGDVSWDWNPAQAKMPNPVFIRPKRLNIEN